MAADHRWLDSVPPTKVCHEKVHGELVEANRCTAVGSYVWIVFNWLLHLNGSSWNGKGQPGPWSDRPTSCRTRMARFGGPTVNGYNDECFFQRDKEKGREREKKTRVDSLFATGLARYTISLSSLLFDLLSRGSFVKSTRFEQSVLVDSLILKQRSCWRSVTVE